ncbi:MAG: alpha-hydroxy acid oxidase [Streptosporangiaceae bacterium]
MTVSHSRRQLPTWHAVAPLLRPQPVVLSGTRRRLAAAATVADLRAIAFRRTPRRVFDYTDGGAGDEISLARNWQAYQRVEFRPSVLRDVSTVDPSTLILGQRSALPIVLAPTGFTRMMHHEGEVAAARAARSAGIPYTLSSFGTTSISDLAAEVPGDRQWFQLYLCRDRKPSQEMVELAAECGYEALVLTVDTPVAGLRLRDVRSGLTIPPRLRLRSFPNGATRPRWWLNLITTAPLSMASLERWSGTMAEVGGLFDPSATVRDVAWLREIWPGKLIVKGVLNPEDACEAVAAGADAIVVSNHGGRQLDRSPAPLDELPAVVQAVGGRAEVYVDGGVLSGGDVAAALCLGATSVLIGRAYLYGLMAGGEAGVGRALDILSAELRQTMQLLGVRSIAELTPDRVRLRASS